MTNYKLQNFYWEGVNHKGEKLRGIMSERSKVLAKVNLTKKGIIIKKIKRKIIFFHSLINHRELTVFVRQLATMLNAEIPLLRCLVIAYSGHKNPAMKMLIESLRHDLESGKPLAKAFTRHSNYFNASYCNLIAAGEKSATLNTVFEDIATSMEKRIEIQQKIRKALVYPTTIALIGLLIITILITEIMPKFEAIYQSFNVALPMSTRVVIYLSKLKFYKILLFFIIPLGVYYYLAYTKKISTKWRTTFDKILLRMPIIGLFFGKLAISRLTKTLSMTLAAGLPLIESLDLVKEITGNSVFASAVEQIRLDVIDGLQLQTAIGRRHLFPETAHQLIAIGEETGMLESMLNKVSLFYENEVNDSLDMIGHLFEPFIIAFLGILVGGLVIVMYLPIFKLGSLI